MLGQEGEHAMLNLISVKEASERFGYSGSHIRGLLSRGLMAGQKLAGVWLVVPKSIEEYRDRMNQLGKKKHGIWASSDDDSGSPAALGG